MAGGRLPEAAISALGCRCPSSLFPEQRLVTVSDSGGRQYPQHESFICGWESFEHTVRR